MVKNKREGFCPNYAVPPGETLEETLRAMDMTQAELAQRTGRPKKTINEIVKGKAAITPETALQFERALGIRASFWNNLERNYRETLARLKEEKALRSQEEYLQELPISTLEKAGWIPKKKSAVEKLQAFLNFFGVAGIKEWKARWMRPQAAYHKAAAFRSNPAMVAAWLRLGEIEASKVSCKSYSANSFRASLGDLRKITVAAPNIFESKMKERCAASGVALLFVPELPGTHVYGATRWLNSNKALIQLSLRGKSDDHLWFAFFHEAAHILLHGKKEVFIEQQPDTKDGGDAIDEKEKAANQFAGEFLIPGKEYNAFLQKEDFSLAAITGFAKELGIAPGIVVGRLQHDRMIAFSQGNSLKKWLKFSGN
jgi:addiction module HigA family antidote